MHLIRCLFFLETWFLLYEENTLADNVSSNRLPLSFKGSVTRPHANPNRAGAPWTAPGRRGHDISTLDELVRFFCNRRLADSTRRTYQYGVNRYMSFWGSVIVPCIPVCITLIRHVFSTLGPGDGNNTAVRHAQIMRSHPEPRGASSLPRLRLVQNGVRRERARAGPPLAPRLPITPALLRRIRPSCLSSTPNYCYGLQ